MHRCLLHPGNMLCDRCGPRGRGPSRMMLRGDGGLRGVRTGLGLPWGLPRVDAHAMGRMPVSVCVWGDLVCGCAMSEVVVACTMSVSHHLSHAASPAMLVSPGRSWACCGVCVMICLFDRHTVDLNTHHQSIPPHIPPSIASPNVSHHSLSSIASLKGSTVE
jgi:hypothetical protein